MSCRGCTEAIECPENDLAPSEGFFATQPFQVLQDCPQGYDCGGEFPKLLTFPPDVIPPVFINPGGTMCIQTCLQLACLVVPAGANDAVKQALSNQLFTVWANDKSFCDAVADRHKKPLVLPSACLGTNYSQVLLRGVSSFSITGGSVPTGMVISRGSTGSVVLGGAPNAGGSFGFTLRTSLGTTSYTINVTAITFNPPGSSATILRSGTVGTPYSATFLAPGYAVLPLRWQVVSGSLPPGLSLDGTTGIVSGTPTGAAATYHFTISLQDHAP